VRTLLAQDRVPWQVAFSISGVACLGSVISE